MKTNHRVVFSISIFVAAVFAVSVCSSGAQPLSSYKIKRLIGSPGSGAPRKDTRMINAWGNAFFSGEPFWINDEASGVSELIDGRGKIFKSLPFVKIPGPHGVNGRPTGIVANPTSDFALSSGGPALFIFDTEDGTIAGWNTTSGGTAVIVVDNSAANASYTGLATANDGVRNLLYAANQNGSIDVFDSSFQPFSTSGGFTDPNLPANLAPYGITSIGNNLFVAYFDGFQPVGQVDEFDPSGTFVRSFVSSTLSAPWGVVMAPANFGQFSNDLLVGNELDGTISAFDPSTAEFLGQLTDRHGHPIAIPGLWALIDGTGAMNAKPHTIYFTAGPQGYNAGVFGMIVPGPNRKPKKGAHATPTATASAAATVTASATASPSATATYPW